MPVGKGGKLLHIAPFGLWLKTATSPNSWTTARIAARVLALTLGMLLNALLGRPPRILVAYDGH
jgi:hypothetical protein